MGTHVRTYAVLLGAVTVLALRGLGRGQRLHADESAAVQAAHPPRTLIRLANPVMRWLLASPRRAGRAADELLVLHVTGRRSGRTYDVPVGYRLLPDGRLVVVTDAVWRLNLRDRPAVEVTLRGTRRRARAELVEDPDTVADVYAGLIDQQHPGASARRVGLRLAEDRVPAHEDLADAVRREHLCVIQLDVGEAVPRTA